MPGAFAHITAVNIAFSNDVLASITNMPMPAKLALSRNLSFCELGAVSPDYPYLAIGHKDQNHWADLMHYQRSGDVIRHAVGFVRQLQGPEQEQAFAWLSGYTSHVMADITIHPVVERIVGPYKENERAHRRCEMNQDAYIWQRLNLGPLGFAERVRQNIGSCRDVNSDRLSSSVAAVWASALCLNYPDDSKRCPPDVDLWHRSFIRVVDTVEDSHQLFPAARHVAVGLGLTYPSIDEVDHQYLEALNTPHGPMHYDEVFDLAVDNIRTYVTYLAQAVFDGREPLEFLSWDLDTGKAPDNTLTAWSK